MNDPLKDPISDGKMVYATEPIEQSKEKEESDEPKYRDKEWLYHQYHVLEKSVGQIADEYGYGKTSIYRWLGKHDIETRSKSEGRKLLEMSNNSPNNKLSVCDVVEIREKYANAGVTQSELGGEYGVRRLAISQVVNGKSWKDVGGPIKGEDY